VRSETVDRAAARAQLGRPTGSLDRRYDVIVVGAGMAGLELAGRLGESGACVAVLEQGPLGTNLHNNVVMSPNEALATWLVPGRDPHFARPWRARRPPHFETGSGLRTRVGGRSLYWYGVVLPVDEWAMQDPAWDQRLVRQLTEPHGWYAETTEHLDRWRGVAVSIDVSAWAGMTLHRTPKAVRPAPANPGRWFAYSPLDRWRDPVTGESTGGEDGVDIHAGASVLQVLLEKGRAVGVLCRDSASGRTRRIEASHVVLAAGTIPSGTLALRALADAGHDRRQLGRLTDHIVQGYFLRLRSAAAEAALAEMPEGSTFARLPEIRSNLFLEVERIAPNEVLIDIRITGEQEPSDRNMVVLDESREAWVDCSPNSADMTLIEAQRARLQATWDDIAGLVGYPSSALDYGDYDRPARGNDAVLPDRLALAVSGVPSTWSSFLGTEDHEGGILPVAHILDLQHEFKDVPGLFAAGPSTFPRMGAANPTFTTLALSRRLSGILVERLQL
jgi:hypothetical protein